MKKTSRNILAIAIAALFMVNFSTFTLAAETTAASSSDVSTEDEGTASSEDGSVTIGEYTYMGGMSEFSEGLALVIDGSPSAINRTFRFIDYTGAPVEMACGNIFHNASSFSEGLAAVSAYFDESDSFHSLGTDYFYIDHNGERAFEGDYEWAGQFSCGYAVVQLDNGMFGFIDHNGEQAFDMEFKAARPFEHEPNGIAYVQFTNGDWGYLYTSGYSFVVSSSGNSDN